MNSFSMEGQPPLSDELGLAIAPTQFTNPAPEEGVGTTAEVNAQPENAFDSKLLAAMWRTPYLVHQIGMLNKPGGSFQNVPVTGVSDAMTRVLAASRAGKYTYFACAEYNAPDSRKASNAAGAYAFWLDVDVGEKKAADGKGYATPEDAKLALTKFCQQAKLPTPTHIVASGGGLHAYWVLDAFVNREVWIEYATKLKALTREFGFLADDSRTSDIASVLRIPGTLNHKYEPPRKVTLKQADESFIEMSQMLAAIDGAHGKLVKPVQAKPKPLSVAGGNAAHAQVAGLHYGPADVSRVSSALAVMNPDCSESEWKLGIIAPLAREARAYPEITGELKQLAISFSSGKLCGKPSMAWVTPGNSNKLTGEQAFEGQWQRFLNEPLSNESRTGLGSIFHNAELAGWIDPTKLLWDMAPMEITSAGIPDVMTVVATTAAQTIAPEIAASAAPDVVPANTSKPKVAAGNQAGSSGLLRDLQRHYALLNMSGKVCVLDRDCLSALGSDGTAKKLVLSSRSDGTLLMSRRAKAFYPDVAAKASLQEFFVSPGTTCYDGIEFNPASTSSNYLNLWVGPTVKPTPGQWPLIKEFLLQVICSGNQSQYDYLIRLIAHALQRPAEKTGVMVILIGGQGIGKGTLGRILRKIWSATYLQVNRVAAITGEFNAALERAFIVVMDEALFAGDHRASDALKSLVTEEVIHINEKHQPARQTASYHRFFIFTNAEHVKSTDRDDRRDFTLRVSESRKDDHAYWATLDTEIQGNGIAAMVHDLLNIDLSGFNVRAKPSTQELVEQKLHSLGGIPRWWYDTLYRGELGDNSDWPDFITTDSIIKSVMELSGRKLHRNPSAVDVMQAMATLCPSATKGQRQASSIRQRGLIIPPLETARAAFEVYIGGTLQWDAEAAQEDDIQANDSMEDEDVY